jgi:hypothetical protein
MAEGFLLPPAWLQAGNQKALLPIGREGTPCFNPLPPAQDTSGCRGPRVFWLPLHPTLRAFPAKSASGIRADFVSGYSCGAATDFHRLPQSRSRTLSVDRLTFFTLSKRFQRGQGFLAPYSEPCRDFGWVQLIRSRTNEIRSHFC